MPEAAIRVKDWGKFNNEKLETCQNKPDSS